MRPRFDMRDLAQVMHHEEPEHLPLSVGEQIRVVVTGEMLKRAAE